VSDAAGWIEAMLVEAAGPETAPSEAGGAGLATAAIDNPGPIPGAVDQTLPGADVLRFSPILGRRIRSDPSWDDAAISTYRKAREAIEIGSWTAAAEYVDFFVDEAAVIYGFFRGLIPDAIAFLEHRGATRDQLREVNARLLDLIRLPDGRPFVARRRWAEFQDHVRACTVACGAADRATAVARLADLKETWRQIQDRDVDHLYGLLNEAVVWWGEAVVGEFWDAIINPLFESRYAKFDIRQNAWGDSLWTNVYLAFESMRGHLVGPDRDGTMEFAEDADRFTWRFDPCGSGGRSLRGDPIEGAPPRMEPPFNYGVTTEEFDFAWNKKGVCFYCVNCCVVMQLMPIDRFGYPVRVVEPPTYPATAAAKCTWHVYKDPAAVPERYYTDVGRRKPASLGGHADPPDGADAAQRFNGAHGTGGLEGAHGAAERDS
jgi:hypothetical protein